MSARNSHIERIHKKEHSILANKLEKKNANNLSFSRLSDSYNQKLSNVKIRLDNQYEVILDKFRKLGLRKR